MIQSNGKIYNAKRKKKRNRHICSGHQVQNGRAMGKKYAFQTSYFSSHKKGVTMGGWGVGTHKYRHINVNVQTLQICALSTKKRPTFFFFFFLLRVTKWRLSNTVSMVTKEKKHNLSPPTNDFFSPAFFCECYFFLKT